jgi:hypothetical protein
MEQLGRDFAEALARRDFGRVGELVDPGIDFRGLTPNRTWEASSAQGLIDEVLRLWLEEDDVVEEVFDVRTAAMVDRSHISYRYRGHNPDGPFVVEQQAYYTARDGRIDWLRVLCSGFRPGGGEPPAPTA